MLHKNCTQKSVMRTILEIRSQSCVPFQKSKFLDLKLKVATLISKKVFEKSKLKCLNQESKVATK